MKEHDEINEELGRLTSLEHNCTDKPDYLADETQFTRRELDAFRTCKHPVGHFEKELLRSIVLLKRYEFRLMWEKEHGRKYGEKFTQDIELLPRDKCDGIEKDLKYYKHKLIKALEVPESRIKELSD